MCIISLCHALFECLTHDDIIGKMENGKERKKIIYIYISLASQGRL